MKRRDIILREAKRLFAEQGFSSTTTLQIAEAAGITEPLIYYHYKGKDGLFTQILSEVLSSYLSRLEIVEASGSSPIGKIETLIHQHIAIVDDEPSGVRMLLRYCPARLNDPMDICRKTYLSARTKLKQIVVDSLKEGVKSGDFVFVGFDATANTIVALLNGLMRQKIASLDDFRGVETAAVDFIKRSLLKT